ncbi:ribonuclease HII [Clostridium sp. LBM24168]
MSFSDINNMVRKLKLNYFDLDDSVLKKIVDSLSSDSRKNVKNLSKNLMNFAEKRKDEISRVKKMYSFDNSFGNYIYIAGVDEVGRGPLAGPIAAGAVVFNLNCRKDSDLILGIKDSKKLSPKKREQLSEIIKERAVSYSIAIINNSEIDGRGISWCNNEVLRRAVKGLKVPVDMVLSDGYAVNNLDIDNKFIIKGDAKSVSIAAASIIAKVYRDKLMEEYDKVYPYYNFSSNSGYGTKEHIEAIKKYGVCKLHRLSFLKNII